MVDRFGEGLFRLQSIYSDIELWETKIAFPDNNHSTYKFFCDVRMLGFSTQRSIFGSEVV